MTLGCGHPLCALLGETCHLATGVSRGCRTGFHPARDLAPDVIAEVTALVATLAAPAAPAAPPSPAELTAATRLAHLFRREARDERNLLVLARDGTLDEPLAAALLRLCTRAR